MPSAPALTRQHRTRLLQLWRSAGWPCQDGLEIDLLAAGLLERRETAEGHPFLRVTEAGIAWLAEARRAGLRRESAHDRLALAFARRQLLPAGRIVWRELARRAARLWRVARPDLFSIRHTTVPAYLRPMVHEVKASRADLLSDLRHAAKRRAYQWLCEECYYVFPVGTAEPEELPPEFGVWVLHGSLDAEGEGGRFELLRPARHVRCTLPFDVWMALCRASPLGGGPAGAQAQLGAPPGGS